MSFVPAAPAASASASVVLVSADSRLADECRLVAAAVGVPLRVEPPAQAAMSACSAAALVLAGRDAPPWLVSTSADVVVVSVDDVVALAEPVELIRLPGGRSRLAARLADAVAPAHGTAIAIVGCAGGVGASTLAVAMAQAARRQSCVVIESDPHGAGFDAALGTERQPGLRWDDVAGTGGTLVSGTLVDGLPRWRGIALLGHRLERDPTSHAGASRAMVHTALRASRREFALTVIDAGRGDVLGRPDALLLVTRPTLAGLTVAGRLRAEAASTRVGLVLRDASIAERVEVTMAIEPWGCDVVSVLPDVGSVQAASERGDLGVALRHRHLRRVAHQCLAWFAAGAEWA